jgi:hypothetical protein
MGSVHSLATVWAGGTQTLKTIEDNVVSIERRPVTEEERDAGIRRIKKLYRDNWYEALIASQPLQEMEKQYQKDLWAWVNSLRRRSALP